MTIHYFLSHRLTKKKDKFDHSAGDAMEERLHFGRVLVVEIDGFTGLSSPVVSIFNFLYHYVALLISY